MYRSTSCEQHYLNEMMTGTVAIAEEAVCHPKTYTLAQVILYSFVVSSSFVIGIYALVPTSIRHIQDRSNIQQIKWRMAAVLIVSIFWKLMYPVLFCDFDELSSVPPPELLSTAITAWTTNLGWSLNFLDISIVVLHTFVLFLGPIVDIILKNRLFFHFQNYHHQQQQQHEKTPYVSWESLRNYVIAPLSEEVVFRSCIVPAFLLHCNYNSNRSTGTEDSINLSLPNNNQADPSIASSLSLKTIILIVPLFFGMAHVHHAYLRIKQGYSLKIVVFSTVFQFMYTTLFGMYSTYMFIKKRSLWAIVISHSFCNFMGFPDFSFLTLPSSSQKYFICASYVLGIFGFIYGFSYF